jgi:hypothetical protein
MAQGLVALEESIRMPLAITEQGAIRIKGSRVSLDSIIHHFKLGTTAMTLKLLGFSLVRSFPPVPGSIQSQGTSPEELLSGSNTGKSVASS